ncbi:hypothetical protein D3C84_456310 [compost metagenome]
MFCRKRKGIRVMTKSTRRLPPCLSMARSADSPTAEKKASSRAGFMVVSNSTLKSLAAPARARPMETTRPPVIGSGML